jgi:hypothetical protein
MTIKRASDLGETALYQDRAESILVEAKPPAVLFGE